MPTLITDSRKEATVASVKKFYNIINNAIIFSVVDNGDVSEWMGEIKELTYAENVEFLKKYIFPYIKYTRYENCYENGVCVYMVGSGMFMFRYDKNGGDFMYFVNGKFENNNRNMFAFQFNKITGVNDSTRMNNKTFVEPYMYEWDGTYDALINFSRRGCRKDNSGVVMGTFCTKLLQMNNWKMTKDYPW